LTQKEISKKTHCQHLSFINKQPTDYRPDICLHFLLAGKIYPYGGKLLSVEKKKEDEVNKISLQFTSK
jgi:hypothetical protein